MGGCFEDLMRNALAAAEARRKSGYKPATQSQYQTELRNFRTFLGARQAFEVDGATVLKFVRSRQSDWTRRRSVSALALLYRHLDNDEILAVLKDSGVSRPSYLTRKMLRQELIAYGYTKSGLSDLRWSTVRNEILNVSSIKSLPKSTLPTLRALLCQRYYLSSKLLGNGPTLDRVFPLLRQASRR